MEHQKVVLSEFLHTLVKLYNEEHPDKLVSNSFFAGVRRKERYIRPLSICLCTKTPELRLCLCAIKASGLPAVPDTLVRQFTTDLFVEHLARADLPDIVSFQTWRNDYAVHQQDKTKSTKKVQLFDEKLSKADFISQLTDDFPVIKAHADKPGHNIGHSGSCK